MKGDTTMKTKLSYILAALIAAAPIAEAKECNTKNIQGRWRGFLKSEVYNNSLSLCAFNMKPAGDNTLRSKDGTGSVCTDSADLQPIKAEAVVGLSNGIGCVMDMQFLYYGYTIRMTGFLDRGRSVYEAVWSADELGDAGTVTLVRH